MQHFYSVTVRLLIQRGGTLTIKPNTTSFSVISALSSVNRRRRKPRPRTCGHSRAHRPDVWSRRSARRRTLWVIERRAFSFNLNNGFNLIFPIQRSVPVMWDLTHDSYISLRRYIYSSHCTVICP